MSIAGTVKKKTGIQNDLGNLASQLTVWNKYDLFP